MSSIKLVTAAAVDQIKPIPIPHGIADNKKNGTEFEKPKKYGDGENISAPIVNVFLEPIAGAIYLPTTWDVNKLIIAKIIKK